MSDQGVEEFSCEAGILFIYSQPKATGHCYVTNKGVVSFFGVYPTHRGHGGRFWRRIEKALPKDYGIKTVKLGYRDGIGAYFWFRMGFKPDGEDWLIKKLVEK